SDQHDDRPAHDAATVLSGAREGVERQLDSITGTAMASATSSTNTTTSNSAGVSPLWAGSVVVALRCQGARMIRLSPRRGRGLSRSGWFGPECPEQQGCRGEHRDRER